MKLTIEEKEIIYNVVEQYLKAENISIYMMDKRGILSKKTLNKILKKNYVSLEEKTLKKILIFPNLNKNEKDKIKNILMSKKQNKNIKKSNNTITAKELIEEIIELKKENEKLKEKFEKTFDILNKNIK